MASEPLQPAIAPLVASRQGVRFAPARLLDLLEHQLDCERDQIGLWVPVALGAGILAWFALPGFAAWQAALAGALAMVMAGLALDAGRRIAAILVGGGLLFGLGLLLAWGKATWVAAPVLARPAIVQFSGRIERVEPLVARDRVRFTVRPDVNARLPHLVRVTIAARQMPAGLGTGARIAMQARLMPPAPPALPGGYDFARRAWFQRIGASGTVLGPVRVLSPGAPGDALRNRLDRHIRAQVAGDAGAVASALATGEQGGVSQAGADAMRRSGLAHLLSVSGLHLTAAAGGTMMLLMRLLALSPWLALRVRLPVVAAAGGALAAIGYTLLTGAEVPTVRSCIAALLVLAALAMGREPMTLRLVAAGAIVVMLLWPEAVPGPSFQLSFAAVTAIIAFHRTPAVERLFAKRDEGHIIGRTRALAALLATGLAVEIALLPISVIHFHKAGLYGAIANLVAIPLTTFVIMPLEAGALLFDTVGAGAPLWWIVGKAMGMLLWIAHGVAAWPGSAAMVPTVPLPAIAALTMGGLWLMLWARPWRLWGLVPVAVGTAILLTAPAPDLLVSGDGRHLAARGVDGTTAILRDRAGDYTQQMLSEASGVDGRLMPMDAMEGVACGADSCVWRMQGRGRTYTLLATRSGYTVAWRDLIEACAKVDIIVSERRLPKACVPRWLKADRALLARTGGLAIHLAAPPQVMTVNADDDAHPWQRPPTITPTGLQDDKRERRRPGYSSTVSVNKSGREDGP